MNSCDNVGEQYCRLRGNTRISEEDKGLKFWNEWKEEEKKIKEKRKEKENEKKYKRKGKERKKKRGQKGEKIKILVGLEETWSDFIGEKLRE